VSARECQTIKGNASQQFECFLDVNEVERRRVLATCLVWPVKEFLEQELVNVWKFRAAVSRYTAANKAVRWVVPG
jgi:hypothetical protein